MKYTIFNAVCFAVIWSIILFFLFPISMDMTYLGERLNSRGYGFPLIYLVDNPTTSVYKIIDLKFLVIDLLAYIILFVTIILTTCVLFKREIHFTRKMFIIVIIITVVSTLGVIPNLLFASFSSIEYIPLYKSMKLGLSYFFTF